MDIGQNLNSSKLESLPEDQERKSTNQWKHMGEKLYSDIGVLFQRDVSLIRSEVREKINVLRIGAVSVGAGLSLIFLSLFALMGTLVLLLGMIIPWWSATLGVTILFAVVGFALYKGGEEKMNIEELRPRHSIETFNEMKNIVKENYHEFKSGPKH